MLRIHAKILSLTGLVRTKPVMTPSQILLPLLCAVSLPLSSLSAQTEGLPHTGLPASDPVVDAIYGLADSDLQVEDLLDQLSNGIGPRLTSSQSLQEACEWAAGQFRSFGIENVRLEEWGTFPVGFDRHSMRGRMITPEPRELVFTTRSWTPGTEGNERGFAFLAPKTEEELDALRGKLSGAWILASSSNVAPRYREVPEGEEEELRDRFGKMCDEEGIFGVVRPGRGELVHTSGNSQVDFQNLPTHTSIMLRRDQFRSIFDSLTDGVPVELEFDIHQTFREGPIPLYNVIAEIPGTDLADQIVIIGGHIDSWDGARGAQDNGTGTSTTLEAARLLSTILAEQNLQPRRTIRFMLWSGEEQGLLGSRAYIKQHPEELEKITGVFVHDGGTNACSGISTTPALKPLFEEVFGPIISYTAENEDEHTRFRLIEKGRLPRGVGSDHDAYLSAGVPGFFWDQFGEANYTYIHHTQNDTTAEVRQDYQRATSRVVASAAWRVSNMDSMLPREENKKPQRLGVFMGEGNKIDGVSDEGMAAEAGMMKGDQLVSIDGIAIASTRDIRKALRESGDRRTVVWQRGEEVFTAIFDYKANKVEKVDS